MSVAEQRVSGRGGADSDPVHQHAVVQRMGELCEGQRQWYESAVSPTRQDASSCMLKKKFVLCFIRASWPH